jgi:hypothetical protein
MQYRTRCLHVRREREKAEPADHDRERQQCNQEVEAIAEHALVPQQVNPFDRGNGGSESDLSRKSNSPVAPRAIDCSSGTDEVRTSSFVLPIRLPLFREGPGALDVIQTLLVLLVSRIDLPHCGFQT